MSHPPSAILQKLLVDFGAAVLPGVDGAWVAYSSHLPDSPNDAIAIYDTAGTIHGRAMVTGAVFEHFGIAMTIRSADYSPGWNKAQAIAKLLTEQVRRTTVELEDVNYLVHAISKTSGVMSLGMESPATRRRLFSVNFLINVRSYLGA